MANVKNRLTFIVLIDSIALAVHALERAEGRPANACPLLPNCIRYCFNHLANETRAVLDAAAVLVGTIVAGLTDELLQ